MVFIATISRKLIVFVLNFVRIIFM